MERIDSDFARAEIHRALSSHYSPEHATKLIEAAGHGLVDRVAWLAFDVLMRANYGSGWQGSLHGDDDTVSANVPGIARNAWKLARVFAEARDK